MAIIRRPSRKWVPISNQSRWVWFSDLRKKLSAHLPNIDWSDPSWGFYEGDGFGFEFNVGKEQESDGFTVRVHGGGDAIEALLRFSIPNRWSLYDCSTGEFIDPKNPSDKGWTGFQDFRDRVIIGNAD